MSDRIGRDAVVVTGLGPITAIGNGRHAFWESLLAGRSGTRLMEFDWVTDRGFKSMVGAPSVPVGPEDSLCTEEEAKCIDPVALLALAAARLALLDAGLSLTLTDPKRNRYRVDGIDPRRIGTILGTGIGGLSTTEKCHSKWLLRQPLTGVTRFSVPMLIPNAVSGQVAIKFGLRGENKVVATACAAGTMAIGDAYRVIRDGELDMVVAGGAEKLLANSDGFGLIGFELLHTLSTRNHDPAGASRPFDVDRDGFVMGEGAGVLVLERREHAEARGAHIYCEVAGYGANSDSFSMVQLEPSGESIVDVINQALRSADLSVDDIDYVNAHGTATRTNDVTEARALRRVFGKRIADVLVNSTKAMTGHSIGAAGGIEAIVTALSLSHQRVHACVNLDRPDPECDLNLPRGVTALKRLAALSNSFGFGGHNASLVLRPA